MTTPIGDAHRQKRDELAKDFVMELLRKARPMSMDLKVCASMTASAYRLADCMLAASGMPTPISAEMMPVELERPKRFITHEPRSVYNDGLWVNVNLDLPGEFSMPSFVEQGDMVKIIRADDSTLVFKAGDNSVVSWANVKSFRKLG
jgi:hypothetical protein